MTFDNKAQNLYLVTGATGTVGQHIVEQLLKKGQSVRALTRNPSHTKFPEQVEAVYGDLTRPETLIPTLKGVTGMHLIAIGGDNYAPLQTGPEIVELAKKAGVQRITVLTGTEDELAVVRAVEASGIGWTHIRPPVEFMANALEWAKSIRTEGVARVSFGNVANAMIHEGDVADIIVTALFNEGHSGKTYEPTGPEAITRKEVIQIISRVIGSDIRFEELSEEQAREHMEKSGIPDDVIEYVIGYTANPPKQAYQVVPVVEQVTGRPARTFPEWAAEHADWFRSTRKTERLL